MTTLTEKFTALEGQLNDDADVNHSDNLNIVEQLELIKDSLASINSDLLLFKAQMAAQSPAIDPYACCTPPSIVIPSVDPTSNPVNQDRCKRAQAFVHAMHEIAGVFGAATDSGIFWSPSVVIGGIQEVITALIEGETVPLPSFPEAVNIAGDAINYGLSNIGRGHNLQSQFDSISSGMVNALYFTSTAGDAQSAYFSIVDASGLPNDEKLLFKALGFNALFSYFFDPESTPDLSPYDGTICSGSLPDITVCTQFSSTCSLGTDGHTRAHLLVPPASTDLNYILGDYFGWTFKYISGVSGIGLNIYRKTVVGGSDLFVTSIAIGNQWTILDHTAEIQVVAPAEPDDACHPFVVEVCPPA